MTRPAEEAGRGRMGKVSPTCPMPDAIQPVRMRLYEVTSRLWGRPCVSLVSARTPAAARYRAYLDADTSTPFRDYQRHASVRLSAGQPADDGYGYIRRAYGVDPQIGQRVTLTGEGKDLEGRGGEVVYPASARHYVHVVLDGNVHPSLVHPRSIVFANAPRCDALLTEAVDG